jgi:lysozyme family protein
VLRPSDSSNAVTDAVITAARGADPSNLVIAICDERLRFLQSLKTWPVFGKGWARRVAEVRAVALAMVANSPAPVAHQAPVQGRALVPAAKAAQQGSAGAIAAAGAVAAQQAHQSGMGPAALAAIVAVTGVLAAGTWLLWRWRQIREQEKPA